MALLSIISFLPSWLNLYAYDDVYIVFHNPLIRSLRHWTRLFRLDYWAPFFHMGLYRPVTILSFALEWQWRPDSAGFYHATNILLHTAVVLLLFRFARLRLRPAAAWVAAAWFAATPLHIGVVAGLVGRADLLAALFALLALWAAEAGFRSPRLRWAAAAAVFPLTLLALGSKESAIVLAGLLCLMVWIEAPSAPPQAAPACITSASAAAANGMATLPPQAAPADSYAMLSPAPAAAAASAPAPASYTPAATPASALSAPPRDALRRFLLPFRQPAIWSCAAATLLYLIVRIRVVGLMVRSTTSVANPLVFAPAVERWRTSLVTTGIALRALLWPFHLSPDYSYNQIPVVARWFSPRLALALALLGACALAAGLARRHRAALFGFAWFFLAWLPVANLLFPIGTIYANRLLYLPSLGAALVIGTAWEALWRRTARLRSAAAAPAPARPLARGHLAAGFAPLQLITLAAALALALIYARTDWRGGQVWSDNGVLFAYAVRVAPNSATVHFMYAGNLAAWGHTHAAIAQFRHALLIDPNYASAWVGLGQALARERHWQAAAQCFPRALALLPQPWVFDAAAPIELGAHHPRWLIRQGRLLDGKLGAKERAFLRQARRQLSLQATPPGSAPPRFPPHSAPH